MRRERGSRTRKNHSIALSPPPPQFASASPRVRTSHPPPPRVRTWRRIRVGNSTFSSTNSASSILFLQHHGALLRRRGSRPLLRRLRPLCLLSSPALPPTPSHPPSTRLLSFLCGGVGSPPPSYLPLTAPYRPSLLLTPPPLLYRRGHPPSPLLSSLDLDLEGKYDDCHSWVRGGSRKVIPSCGGGIPTRVTAVGS